ncbi:hypothetical protein BH20GEM1_BH20GEM1_10400 [soil metagenome]
MEGRGDVARARRFLQASADVIGAAGHARLAAEIAFYERDYEAGIAALEGQPVEPDAPTDAPLWLALLSRSAGRQEDVGVWADSLAAAAQREIEGYDSASVDPFVQQAADIASRGVAHALAGRTSEAVRDARRAMELLPISRDAVDAPRVHHLVADLYVLAGDRDAAFRVLDTLAAVPSGLSAAVLRLSPFYDSLREDPRYPALLSKLEAAERTGTGTR